MEGMTDARRSILLLVLVSLVSRWAWAAITEPPGQTPELPETQQKDSQESSPSVEERLEGLETRITLRDEELVKVLQLLLANQKELQRLLQQEACFKASLSADCTPQPSDWPKPCSRSPASSFGLPMGQSSAVGSGTASATGTPAAYRDASVSVYRPRSCREIPDGMSGEYTIYPGAGAAGPGEPLDVYCDQDYEEGGWIVIQNRFDGFVNFNRSWEKYRDGFGDIGTEYWLGLDAIHRVTVAVPHELAFVAESFRGERRWARYSLFEIAGETDRYRLQKLGVYSGTLGDEFTYNKGMEFSTYDQDHDQFGDVNCALRTASGWWHRSCTRINLNGIYGNETGVRFAYWLDWLHLQGLKRTRIMIRETKKRRK